MIRWWTWRWKWKIQGWQIWWTEWRTNKWRICQVWIKEKKLHFQQEKYNKHMEMTFQICRHNENFIQSWKFFTTEMVNTDVGCCFKCNSDSHVFTEEQEFIFGYSHPTLPVVLEVISLALESRIRKRCFTNTNRTRKFNQMELSYQASR